jgi:hypothetical protein
VTKKKTGVLSREEALELARAKKGTQSGAGLFYGLLENAHPKLLEFFEDQLAIAIQAGTAMGEHLGSLEPGSPEYNEFLRMASAAASKTSFDRQREAKEAAAARRPKSEDGEAE